MLGDQQRRPQLLAQTAVPRRRDPRICVRVLVPHVPVIVEHVTEAHRVAERPQGRGDVVHERHAIPHGAPDSVRDVDLLLQVAPEPAVDLERSIAEIVAPLGEAGICVARAEAVRVVVADRGRSVRREWSAPPAEQLEHRCVVPLAGEVPQRDVDRAVADPSVLARDMLAQLVRRQAIEGVTSDEQVGEVAHSVVIEGPPAHILAGHAHVGEDADRIRMVDRGERLRPTPRMEPLEGDRLDPGNRGGLPHSHLLRSVRLTPARAPARPGAE